MSKTTERNSSTENEATKFDKFDEKTTILKDWDIIS